MLRVTNFTKINEFYLGIDDYVPLTFRCVEVASTEPLYWRIGDFVKSLMQIGLNHYSGELCSLTITLIGKYSLVTSFEDIEAESIVDGLPICSIEDWGFERYIDENIDFDTFIGDGKIYIWLGGETKLKILYNVGRLIIGSDFDGFIRFVQINDIDEDKISKIKKLAAHSYSMNSI